MQRRLLLLLMLCVLLMVLRALPNDAIETMSTSEYLIWVDMRAMSLTLYKGKTQMGRWPVAVGRGETPTPIGVYKIHRRFAPTESTGFGTRFLGIDVPWGLYGIHGTNNPASIGDHASHGCIRMYSRDIEKVYAIVPNGTKVVIEDGPYGQLSGGLLSLPFGARGSQVAVAQKRLYQLGYYEGSFDGIYGKAMSNALKRFKEDHGLPWVDKIDQATWDAMEVFLFE